MTTALTVIVPAVLTLLGTLAGSWLTSRNQARHTRDHAGLSFAHTQAQTAVTIAADLLHAIDAHRNAMWYLEDARERGHTQDEQTWLRASESTRDALTRPHLLVRCLIPAAAQAAHDAVLATYAMNHTGALGQLKTAQFEAKARAVAYERAVITAVHHATVGDQPIPLTTRAITQ